MLLSRRNVSLFLLLFLVVDPASLVFGSQASYRWKNQGCRAVFTDIMSGVKDVKIDRLFFLPTEIDPTNKELHDVFAKIGKVLRANSDKLASGVAIAGVLASSCLLYESVLLTAHIQVFFDQFEELKGTFDAFVRDKTPQIQPLLMKIEMAVAAGSAPEEKDIRQVEYVLYLYSNEIYEALDRVGSLIEEAREAGWYAKFTAAVSFVVGVVVAVVAYLTRQEVSFPRIYGSIRAAINGVSIAAGVFSNQALEEVHKFKEDVHGLKRRVLQWMTEVKKH